MNSNPLPAPGWLRLLCVAAFALAAPAAAQTMTVTVNIPRLSVAEYHRPYVAIWLEKEGAAPRTLAVWYDVDKAKGEGKCGEGKCGGDKKAAKEGKGGYQED